MNPKQKPPQAFGKQVAVALVVSLVMCSGVALWQLWPQPNSSPESTVRPYMESTDLRREYQDNAIAADYRYKNMPLVVQGTIDNFSSSGFDSSFIRLKGDVRCSFSNDKIPQLTQLQKGQTIVVRGTCSGKFITGEIDLANCTIEQSR